MSLAYHRFLTPPPPLSHFVTVCLDPPPPCHCLSLFCSTPSPPRPVTYFLNGPLVELLKMEILRDEEHFPSYRVPPDVSYLHALIPRTKVTGCKLTITKKKLHQTFKFRKSNSLFTKFNIILIHLIFAILVLWRGNED